MDDRIVQWLKALTVVASVPGITFYMYRLVISPASYIENCNPNKIFFS